MKSRLIILDRDGVINHDSPDYIKSPEEWQALPGSLDAIAQLSHADYRVVIITNQSGIAQGMYTINTLNRIHQKMMDELQPLGGEINAIFFCPHGPDDNCACRKPKPGLFLELADRLKCNLKEVISVGDSMRDLLAARTAGAKPVLVETGNGAETIQALQNGDVERGLKNIPVFKDLADFVDTLLAFESLAVDSPGSGKP